jgi:hypothetical protein
LRIATGCSRHKRSICSAAAVPTSETNVTMTLIASRADGNVVVDPDPGQHHAPMKRR